jgi:hypothetical protein
MEHMMYQNSKLATVYAQNNVMMYQQELLIQQKIFLLVTMDSLTDENRLVFMKTDKIGPDWFYRFTENRSVQFKVFKNLRNFKIKNPKKLAFI